MRASCGAAAVGIAVPTVQHVSWASRDFTRQDYSPEPPIAPEGRQAWANWAGVQRATPKNLFTPNSEDDLAYYLAQADGRIRPRGSGHSFSGLVPSDGTILDVSRFSGLAAFNEAEQTATFGAGTTLFQVAGALNNLGRAFPNLPDIVDQTMAGSFSTATHGTGLNLSAIHDYIESFRMVLADGDIVEASKDQNAELFEAGKVSLGALGVITSYTVKTTPTYNLQRVWAIESIEDVLSTLLERPKQHRNFEFFYLPGTGKAATLSHDILEGDIAGIPPSEDDELLEGLKQIRNQFGWWPWLRRRIASSSLPSGVIEEGSESWHNLLATTRAIKFNEMEYHLPLEEGESALRSVIEMLDSRRDAFFPMELRFVAADDAWLSPFNRGPTMSIAIHAAVDEPFDYFFSEFEPLFLKHGGRPHWGKWHGLKNSELASLYDKFAMFEDLRRELDPTGKFLNKHLEEMFCSST